MGIKNIRFGSQLTFDEGQEKDIIAVVEQLNQSHKMGQFMSNLIRIALENPEILDIKDGKYEMGAITQQLDKLGISYNRKSFMTAVSKEVADMKAKVDSIYDMTMQLYTLALMGKHIGIEDKSNNLLMSTFVLEKQLKELQDTLGVHLADSVYASNKMDTTHKKADDTLEYIINNYSGIVEELKSRFEIKTMQVEQPIQQVYMQPATQTVQQPVVQVQNQVPVTPVVEVAKPEVVEEPAKPKDEDSSEEFVDFGNADFGALGNFFDD